MLASLSVPHNRMSDKPVALDTLLSRVSSLLQATDALRLDLLDDQTSAPVIVPKDWRGAVLAASAQYRQATVLEDGEVLASVPYFVRRSRLGFRWGRNPDWSIPTGLHLEPRLTSNRRAQVLEDLVRQLPATISLYLVFSEDAGWSQDVPDAFTRNGFEYSRVPTYQWAPSDGDVLALMKSKARSQLKRAQECLEIREIGADDFLDYYHTNLVLENARPARSLHLAKELLRTGSTRGVVRIIAASRPAASADYDAAIACTWDSDRYYYWMSSHRPHINECKPHKDAGKVLVLDAMRHARSLGLIFDTDGAGSTGSEHLYRDILKLRRADIRHVFQRPTRFAACYAGFRPLLLALRQKIYRAG